MQRFLAKIRKTKTCWLWTAYVDKKGYGTLSVSCKIMYAHRFAYELWIGPIPDGLCVCHTCDNPSCVNPNHLWLGTRKDNVQDSIKKGRFKFNLDLKPKHPFRFKPGNTLGFKPGNTLGFKPGNTFRFKLGHPYYPRKNKND